MVQDGDSSKSASPTHSGEFSGDSDNSASIITTAQFSESKPRYFWRVLLVSGLFLLLVAIVSEVVVSLTHVETVSFTVYLSLIAAFIWLTPAIYFYLYRPHRMEDARRREMLRLVRDSELRYRTVVAAASDGIIYQDSSGRILAWNRKAEETFGISSREVVGETSISRQWQTYREDGTLFPAADHPSMQTLRTGQPCRDVIVRVERSKGDSTWVNVNTNPVFGDGNKELVGVVITFTDITRHRQMESVAGARERILQKSMTATWSESLRIVLDEAESLTASSIGFFHFLEADQETIRLQNWSTRTVNEFCQAEGMGAHYPLGKAGVWADSIRERKTVIYNDYAGLKHRKGIPPGHAHVDRFVSIPILRNGRIVAIIGVGNKQSDYTEWDAQTVSELADMTWDIVAHKRTLEDLVASETRWHFAIDGSGDGVWDWNAETGEVYYSAQWKGMLGFQEDEIGTSLEEWSTRVHPDDLNRTLSALSDLLEGRTDVYSCEHRIRAKDGSYKWILDRGKVVRRLPDGSAAQLIGTHTDMTARKEAEEKLRESQERFAQVSEQTRELVWEIDAEGMYTYVSSACRTLLGYEESEIVGKLHFFDRHPEPGREEFRRQALAAIQQRLTFRELFNPVVTKDGRVLEVLTNGVPVIGPGDVLLGYRGSDKDITERRAAAEALRASETRYQLLFDSVNEGIVVVGPDESIQFCNPAFKRLLEAGRDEDLIGRSLLDFVAIELREMVLGNTELRRRGISSQYEIDLITLTGSRRSVMVSVTPNFEHGETYASATAIMSDITETKRLRELESRAQRLETVGRIAGQVAHDFNNLLGPIMAYPELMRDELPPDHQLLDYINAMESAAHQIAAINQDLLTLGRRGHYTTRALNLNQIIAQSVREMQLISSAISCDLDLASDLMSVQGGEAQLQRAISNLLHNAVDAVKENGKIFIRTENFYVDNVTVAYERVPQGEYVKVTIADTGVGIADDIVQKIFEPFFTTKRANRTRGSGLGLSVVDAVIRDHGGYVDLRTQIGHGTSFYLYFPACRDADTSGEREIATSGGDELILVVDDDAGQREVLSRLLGKLGYAVETAESGEEAIGRLRTKSYDLLVLDMIMPGGIDGTETFQRAKEIRADQQAIMVSGFSESDRVNDAKEMGLGVFLKKPLTLAQLAHAARIALDRRRSPVT